MTPARALERSWATRMTALGTAVRELRTTLGWSQQELATHAATSQGAISRVESGHHEAMLLRTVVQVLAALAAAIPPVAAAVSPALRELCALATSFEAASGPPMPPPDPALATFLRTYHALAPAHRRAFMRLVVPLAAYLAALPAHEHAA